MFAYCRRCQEVHDIYMKCEDAKQAAAVQDEPVTDDIPIDIPWDDRDFELGLPSKMQSLIAEITSGVSGAKPTGDDLVLANRVRTFIESELRKS
jgi:hypothetical protein